MKVHILQWASSGAIAGVYRNKEKAENIADSANEKVTWVHKFAGLFSGKLTKWIVVEYEVR